MECVNVDLDDDQPKSRRNCICENCTRIDRLSVLYMAAQKTGRRPMWPITRSAPLRQLSELDQPNVTWPGPNSAELNLLTTFCMSPGDSDRLAADVAAMTDETMSLDPSPAS